MAERICKKCLMWEGMPEGMEKYLETHMGAIPEEERAERNLQEERLILCRECRNFTEGICRACGCYVYLRTAVKKQRCPYKKWLAVEK
ncbi:MAG: hypothetical protein IKL07_05240 [Clostridium sp.]|nr:hypothetical protein [Clostridium sp.]